MPPTISQLLRGKRVKVLLSRKIRAGCAQVRLSKEEYSFPPKHKNHRKEEWEEKEEPKKKEPKKKEPKKKLSSLPSQINTYADLGSKIIVTAVAAHYLATHGPEKSIEKVSQQFSLEPTETEFELFVRESFAEQNMKFERLEALVRGLPASASASGSKPKPMPKAETAGADDKEGAGNGSGSGNGNGNGNGNGGSGSGSGNGGSSSGKGNGPGGDGGGDGGGNDGDGGRGDDKQVPSGKGGGGDSGKEEQVPDDAEDISEVSWIDPFVDLYEKIKSMF